jgi:CRP/FNR family cyclic AMP-dependent transcriptional regulator
MKFLKLFKRWKDVAEYPAHTVIFSAGDPADVMYFILSGEVELTLHGESIGTDSAGDMIGEMAMVPSATYSATATSLSGVKLARLNDQQLKELASENTEFSLHVMSILANRLRSIDKYISTHITQSDQLEL